MRGYRACLIAVGIAFVGVATTIMVLRTSAKPEGECVVLSKRHSHARHFPIPYVDELYYVTVEGMTASGTTASTFLSITERAYRAAEVGATIMVPPAKNMPIVVVILEGVWWGAWGAIVMAVPVALIRSALDKRVTARSRARARKL